MVVGSGLRAVAHATHEAVEWMRRADRLLHLVADPVTERWLQELSPRAEGLRDCYAEGRPRAEAYAAMVERILAPVRAGELVVACFYGHPGVFVRPGHDAVARARAEGLAAEMLPAVSALDCLFADLGVDPASDGCACFEATDLLVHGRTFDPTCHLVVWQVGVVGELAYRGGGAADPGAVALLVAALAPHYPVAHEAVVYEAAQYPVCPPRTERVRLDGLPAVRLTSLSTLYVPPAARRPADPAMLARLLGGDGWQTSGARDES